MFGLNLGATSSSASAAAAHAFNNALEFDGTNDYANFSAQTEVVKSSEQFVISFWFKSKASSTNPSTDFVATSSNEGDYIIMGNASSGNNGRPRLKINGSSYQCNFAWSDQAWHHYYFYRDGSNDIYIVVDGVNQGNVGTNSANIEFNNFGKRNNNTLYLRGFLDDFFVAGNSDVSSSVTPSLAKAQAIYNSGNGANPQTIEGDNGVVYFKFDESSGSTASDSSGNSNDLTLNNFTGTYFDSH